MTHPRSAFGAPPQGGGASGRAEPVRGAHLMGYVLAATALLCAWDNLK